MKNKNYIIALFFGLLLAASCTPDRAEYPDGRGLV